MAWGKKIDERHGTGWPPQDFGGAPAGATGGAPSKNEGRRRRVDVATGGPSDGFPSLSPATPHARLVISDQPLARRKALMMLH